MTYYSRRNTNSFEYSNSVASNRKYEICPNASAQKALYEKIKTARNKITEFESLYNIASDTSIRSDLASQHSARKSQNSNLAIHEFIYSQLYMLIELYMFTQSEEIDFKYSLSNSETLR
ncbi:18684_t:CDS:2 [Dentiscutata erythropus]|uniref:18684_t:CDS:1 n=1 Tax=Dentiscutata erythropus TaxID=1348616 RepID=A0A9N9H401_9GLOM|nr:18684_t:CDS:2 [Dentiscutata erythropus]